MKLAAIACFYSFAPFKRPVQNLHRFLRQMEREGVKVFGVEAHLNHRPPLTLQYPNWRQISVSPKTQVLWHKEALLNLAEKLVPAEFDALAWIDTDVWFSNPNWVQDAEKKLETHDVVQLFSEARWTSEMGDIEMSRPSVALVPLTSEWKSHPGFAWAMRRDFWKKIGGLFPFALSGGGDGVAALAFQNKKLWPFLYTHLGADPSLYNKWAKSAKDARVSCIEGDCYHEWHGSREDRKYVDRAQVVSRITIGRDVVLAPNGLPTWTAEANPALIRAVADYFIQRNEDGNA